MDARRRPVELRRPLRAGLDIVRAHARAFLEDLVSEELDAEIHHRHPGATEAPPPPAPTTT